MGWGRVGWGEGDFISSLLVRDFGHWNSCGIEHRSTVISLRSGKRRSFYREQMKTASACPFEMSHSAIGTPARSNDHS